MTEIELNNNDKLRLRADIKITRVFALLFSIALVTIVGLIPGVFFVLGKQPSHSFVSRSLLIIGLLFIPLLSISWTNLLKYIDLKKGKKQIFNLDDFEVISKKEKAFIKTGGGKKQKLEIDNKLIGYIKNSQPLRIEIAGISKSLLFISHDKDNLLDKIYND